MTEDGRERGERLQIMLSAEELVAIDDFRFASRMPTRAAAIRELLKMGLSFSSRDATPGMKSSDYGVLGRRYDPGEPHSNKDGEDSGQN